MATTSPEEKTLRGFGPYTLAIGILLLVLGTIGLVVPNLMSLATAVYVGWMLIIGGVFWSYHTWKYHRSQFMDWLKPVVLMITGGLMLFNPLSGVAAVGLLLAMYLLLDTFGSVALARGLYPAKGWGWMAFNAVVSLALAMMFLIGWPATSLFPVGIYVAISLIFDGWALIIIGWTARKQLRGM